MSKEVKKIRLDFSSLINIHGPEEIEAQKTISINLALINKIFGYNRDSSDEVYEALRSNLTGLFHINISDFSQMLSYSEEENCILIKNSDGKELLKIINYSIGSEHEGEFYEDEPFTRLFYSSFFKNLAAKVLITSEQVNFILDFINSHREKSYPLTIKTYDSNDSKILPVPVSENIPKVEVNNPTTLTEKTTKIEQESVVNKTSDNKEQKKTNLRRVDEAEDDQSHVVTDWNKPIRIDDNDPLRTFFKILKSKKFQNAVPPVLIVSAILNAVDSVFFMSKESLLHEFEQEKLFLNFPMIIIALLFIYKNSK